MYDGGMIGGWAHLAQGPGIQDCDFWSRRVVTRPPLPPRHLHNRLRYRRNTCRLHRCNLRRNTVRTRRIQSVHRLRLPPHMNCSTLPLESSPLIPWILSPGPLSAARKLPWRGGCLSRRPVITYTAPFPLSRVEGRICQLDHYGRSFRPKSPTPTIIMRA